MFNSSVNNKSSAQRPQTFNNTFRPNNVPRPNSNNNRRTTGSPAMICEHCGFNGYIIDMCFKLIGYPADCGKRNNISNTNQNTQNFNRIFMNNNISVGSSSTSGLSDEQTKLLSLIKDNSLNDRGKGVQANMAGANQHLTYTDKNLVNVIDISYLRIKVSHPNGTEALITKVGNLKLTNFLTLYDVLVVPEYSVTLVSIHKVARDSKFIVGFNESKCFLMVVSTEGHRMPSSVLKGKSPYQLFSSRAEKCVLIGYSSFKKGYKLFSLERKQFVFSRDVKFFENVFPFKIRYSSVDKVSQDLDHVNFFDEIVHEGPDTSYNDTNLNVQNQNDGSNSSQPSSPTIDQFEGDLGHSQGSNGSDNENEMAATSDNEAILSKDDNYNIQTT
ncbi:hypothetical protein Tco_0706279 [Tanacetum coccineum]|uniref:Retroviral polymerase SH3-like domain-containing protein n=1 Tax=Tanacetum coccineum TaxID=301880 RepID=A0ABQ4Y6X8_9ASTR